MEPAAALDRIGFLLEATRAPTYKVRAFRKAAVTVGATEPARLADLADRHRLEDLDGVGTTTATVVAQALAGDVPDYLAELEASYDPGPPSALGSALRGDCHSHSEWSDGSATIDQMAATARDLGRSYQALTDHSPRLTVAHGLDAERLTNQLAEVARVNEELAPFRLLSGIEVDILEDGALDQDEAMLARLDVVVASVHSKLRMERGPMTARMLAAIESPHTDILGHCTGRLVEGKGRPPSAFDAAAVFAACARTGTAVEVNSRPERQDPPDELIAQALDAGCLFAIDTDAHAPGQLAWQVLGARRAEDAGIPADRVVNTWELERFVAWTHREG
jgi:putative hydrolase